MDGGFGFLVKSRYPVLIYSNGFLNTIQRTKIMADYKSNYLQEVLETHKMKHIKDVFDKYRDRRNEIKDFLNAEYGSRIYSPFDSGSYSKHTAVNTKFDLDAVVPFKYKSFNTLEDMFSDIYNKLNDKFNDRTTVRKQGVSIGLAFEEDGIDIDIVPARETRVDGYTETRNLNLHINSLDPSETGYLKTNIQSQINHISGKDNERKIIRLLKIWKFQKSKKYKSFFFELLVIKAYDSTLPTGNLWEQFKTVLQYIVDNIESSTFKLPDPGNSNNDLMSTLDSYQKTLLKSDFEWMLTNIENNEKQIEYYFEKNKEFSEGASNNGLSYGVAGATPVSTPSSKQRFG
ncbi:nucleotidyltransferase [Psychrobacter piscatorii]|nr:nucleotidyltransferase [Psychrobacter piscatorii]